MGKKRTEEQNFAAVELTVLEKVVLGWGGSLREGTEKAGGKGHISSCTVEGTELFFRECTGNVKAGKGLRTAQGSLI